MSDEEDNNPQQQPGYKKPEFEQNEELQNDDAEDDEEGDTFTQVQQAKALSAGITVCVGNHKEKDGGTFKKKYTVYEVSGTDKSKEFRVDRRYSDFFALRNKLVENWPGYFIPPIPEKKSTGNLEKEFVEMRQHMLNHFMARCGKMPHIWNSKEMEVFLKTTSGDVAKAIESIPKLSPTEIYERNKTLFPEHDKDLSEKVRQSVDKYFLSLDRTIKFFTSFRASAKNLYAQRSKFKILKTQFMRYAINDYKNKLKDEGDKRKIMENCNGYIKQERDDDLSEFLKKLKDLEQDLASFYMIKKDLEMFTTLILRTRKRQEEANNNLTKTRSLEGNEVKDGLFKKVSKQERLQQLENEINQVSEFLT
jgi:PX domain